MGVKMAAIARRPALPEDLPEEATRAYVLWSVLLVLTAVVMLVNLFVSGNAVGALGLLLVAVGHSGVQGMRKRSGFGRPLATVCGIVLIVVQLGTLALVFAWAADFGPVAVLLSALIGLATIGLVIGSLVMMHRPSVSAFLAVGK